jgi:hypothetical protein
MAPLAPVSSSVNSVAITPIDSRPRAVAVERERALEVVDGERDHV